MSALFKASDIVSSAILIEENGYKFYRQVSADSRFYELKELTEFLAKEEKAHSEAFKKILKNLPPAEMMEAYPGEYQLYLKALAGDNIFTASKDPAGLARSFKKAEEIIDFGIGIEKDSIIFYEGLKETILKGELSIIEELISQERNHLLKLLQIKPNRTKA
jgi:rubrerythrin